MAATKTSRNDTPNTPDVSETRIARMKVDELRHRLRGHGVKGTADMKKPDLVKKLIKVETSGGRKKSGSAKKSISSTASSSSSRNPTSRNDTPNTPEVDESRIARMKADELRHRLRGHGVKGTADMKKPELVKKLVRLVTRPPGKKSSGGGGKRINKASAR